MAQAAIDLAAIDLATVDDFRLGPLLVRPSIRATVRDDDRRELLEARVMQVLVALASRFPHSMARHRHAPAGSATCVAPIIAAGRESRNLAFLRAKFW